MTFCIAIKVEIPVPACPLPKGRCMWQHRESHDCSYTEQEMTVEQFSQHVGMKRFPTEEQVGKWMVKLRRELRDQGFASSAPRPKPKLQVASGQDGK